jgi:hypothetical protein
MQELRRRCLNLLVALDQLLCCIITLGSSKPVETVSAMVYNLERQRRWQGLVLRPVLDRIFWLDPNHCAKSFKNLRNSTTPEYWGP